MTKTFKEQIHLTEDPVCAHSLMWIHSGSNGKITCFQLLFKEKLHTSRVPLRHEHYECRNACFRALKTLINHSTGFISDHLQMPRQLCTTLRLLAMPHPKQKNVLTTCWIPYCLDRKCKPSVLMKTNLRDKTRHLKSQEGICLNFNTSLLTFTSKTRRIWWVCTAAQGWTGQLQVLQDLKT